MRSDETHLLDMLLAAEKIQRFIKEISQQQFLEDEMRQSAVLREIQVIGEAARLVSEDFKGKHETIPWGQIAGMRNRVIHEYFRVSLEIIWTTIQTDIPNLIREIRPLIPVDKNDSE